MACITITNLAVGVLVFFICLRAYVKFTTKRCKSKTCLVGKSVIITGADSGIGYETALDLAGRGAKIILAGVERKRAEEARLKIIEETGNENVFVKFLDLASFESVRAFAREINATEERLDILINNAGIFGVKGVKSVDGHVLVMQINYLSHFLLTHLLIDLLKKSGPSRIVNVGSIAAKEAKNFDVDKIDVFPGSFKIYSHSKLCVILFTRELAKRLQGSQVTTHSVHPGIVNTDILRNLTVLSKFLTIAVLQIFYKTTEDGAQTTIHTAVAKDIENFNGEHFAECTRIKPYKTVTSSLEKKLWEKTIDLIKMKQEEIRI